MDLALQLQEINQGALQKGEDQELAQQEKRLANAEKLVALWNERFYS